MTLKTGDAAPAFTLPATGGVDVTLDQFKGQNIVVYFYPKDDTPGCTQQACDIRDNINALQGSGTHVIGISKDDVASHEKFKTKFNLNYPLAADTETTVSKAYGAWGEKSMYGKVYEGVIRSTFLIDRDGIIWAIWRNVKVADHLPDIFEALDKLKTTQAA